MSRQNHAELGLRVLGRGFPPAGDGGHTVSEIGRSAGDPPLPAALLWAAVGDLDVIDRLRRHVHQVCIPDWSCSSCGSAWPCDTARRELLFDLGWSKLSIYCSVLMERAARDFTAIEPRILWQRFLEWTEPPDEARAPYSNNLYNVIF